MRVLLGGDFHLGARQSWLGPQAAARRDDLERSLVRFVDFALNPANKVDLVLLLGDLFDRHAPEEALVDHAVSQVERLLARGLPVAAIPGTHDGYGYADSIYRSPRWPQAVALIATPHLSRRTIEVAGSSVHLYGLAYDPALTPPEPLAGLRRDPEAPDGFHIAMVHGSLPASPEWEYRRRDLPVPTADLAGSGFHLLAMGHYHNFMEKRFGDTTVVYPGTLEGLKLSEQGVRAFTVASLEGGSVTIERVPYPGREITERTFDVDRMGTSPGALEEEIVKLAGRDQIVRVVLTGEGNPGFDAASLCRKLGASFFHLVIDDRTVRVDERWAARIASENTVRGLFVRKMKDRISTAPESEKAILEAALRAGLQEFGASEGVHGN